MARDELTPNRPERPRMHRISEWFILKSMANWAYSLDTETPVTVDPTVFVDDDGLVCLSRSHPQSVAVELQQRSHYTNRVRLFEVGPRFDNDAPLAAMRDVACRLAGVDDSHFAGPLPAKWAFWARTSPHTRNATP